MRDTRDTPLLDTEDARHQATRDAQVHGHDVRTPADAAAARELAVVFRNACGARVARDELPHLESMLARLCQRAWAAHPTLPIDTRDLVAAIGAHVATRARHSGGISAYLARCRAGELALARLASRGVATAIAAFERAHAGSVEDVCRRYASARHPPALLGDLLRRKLLVGESRVPAAKHAGVRAVPKLATYSGQGSLDTWLRVTAVRLFVDLGIGMVMHASPSEIPARSRGKTRIDDEA
ncbi:MAG TPA: hypothetical protein VK427_24490 [Kofleriaceae bacterium]|nr:hypothetical protein [Kofleriaceae bacterium]